MRDLTINDLVDAYFNAEKYRDWAKGMSEYHAMRLDILTTLFECHIPPQQDGFSESNDERDRDLVAGIARSCLKHAKRTMSPFGWYLEGTPGPLEALVRAQHQQGFDTAERAVQDRYRAIFRTALEILNPAASGRSFPQSVLFERGLPRSEPEEMDFW